MPLYKYFLTNELEVFGKANSLRSTILEKLCSLHGATSFL